MGWIGLAVTVAAAWWLVRSLRQLEGRALRISTAPCKRSARSCGTFTSSRPLPRCCPHAGDHSVTGLHGIV